MKRSWLVPVMLLAACGGAPHRYTCAELLGPDPTPGYMAILPPGYSFTISGFRDFSVRDERNRLVCDAKGRDVR